MKGKLKLNHSYLNRNGDSVKIIEHNPGMIYEFRGDNGETYTHHGNYDQTYFGEHELDLIEEVIPEQP